MTWRIATRRSALAQAQSAWVGRALGAATGREFELVPMTTSGDRDPQRAVAAFEVKGLFVDTIRAAVLDGDCHLAVHSYKDLPSDAVDGLMIAAVPEREDPRDLLVTREGVGLGGLPRGAVVATSSVRRRVQLLRARPDLQVVEVRGNVDTRLRRVAERAFDAVVVAAAGVRRLYGAEALGGVGALGIDVAAVALEPGECLPAPAQGALALECRTDEVETAAGCASVHDALAGSCVRAERAFLERIGGGCLAPIGAWARPIGTDDLELSGMLAEPDGRRMLRRAARGTLDAPEALGRGLAEVLLSAGEEELLDAIGDQRARQS